MIIYKLSACLDDNGKVFNFEDVLCVSEALAIKRARTFKDAVYHRITKVYVLEEESNE